MIAITSGCAPDAGGVVSEPSCTPDGLSAACADGDQFACRWISIYGHRGDATSIAGATSTLGDDLDAALIALVPELVGKTLIDRELPVPAPPSIELVDDPVHLVGFPVDWEPRPDASRTWRLYFQSLTWVDRLCRNDNDADLDAGLYALVDWAERAQYREPALEYTWDDHAMAIRLSRAASCLEQYLARRDVLDRRIVQALSSIVLTHLYALGCEVCYVPNHNHGVMQDLALLSNVRRYPALVDGAALWDLAARRMDDQVSSAVSADGIHRENSPAYHLLFLRMLTDAIDVYQQWGETPSSQVTEARNALLEAVIYQLQPDFSLPQFGDTENVGRDGQVSVLVSRARDQEGGAPAIYDQLDWVLSDGSTGIMPSALDRVFTEGGYAAFRSAWDPAAPRDVISAHFACRRDSPVHYHKDETSFELYGYGQELIVDSGKFSYDSGNPMAAYQYEVHAHNVLVVDDGTYQPTGRPQLVAHDLADDLAWVQGRHDHWAAHGVSSMVRTFAYAKPASFVVVDHVRADGGHRYDQHFHLHPSLSELTQVGNSVIATVPGGDGPTVVLTPQQAPTTVELRRGIQEPDLTQGWYFFSWQDAQPTTDVSFRYQREDTDLDLPVLITLSGPGEAARIPTEVGYEEDAEELRVWWTVAGSQQRVAIPLPPAP